MVRIFYLTSEYLWPPHHGGRVRSLAQLRLLSSLPEVERVIMLGLTEVPVTTADEDALAAELPLVRVLPPIRHPIHLRQHPVHFARVAGLRLLRRLPYLAAKWDGPAIHRALRRHLRQPFDVVYIDHLGMARYLELVRRLQPRARVVVEAHNVESEFFRQFAERQRGLLRLFGLLELAATRRFEAEVLRAADAVVAISLEDARLLEAHTGVRPEVVPQVVPFARVHRPPPQRPQLCYVGNLTWHPNVRGLDWFCAHVWPRVRAAEPATRLVIAGSGLLRDATGRLRVPPGWRAEGIEVVGFLPDLEPLYESSSAMVAPVLGGSGIRIKLLEALRAGMPTVTTAAGAAGLPLRPGQEVLVEDDPTRFAEATLRLLRDEALRQQLREAGYRFLGEHHTLAAAQAAMRRVLQLAPGARPCY